MWQRNRSYSNRIISKYLWIFFLVKSQMSKLFPLILLHFSSLDLHCGIWASVKSLTGLPNRFLSWKFHHDLASFNNLLWPNPVELADNVIDKCLLIQGLLSFSDFGRKCVILTLLPPFNCLVLFSCLEWSEDREKIGD